MFNDCLQGVRVLDLSQYIPGPFATMTLSDLGADVVKIEPPFGDPMRQFLMQDEDGISPLYKQLNGGKTVINLDLKSSEGKDHFRQLVKEADVLLESFRPGVMSRLGFGPDELRALNAGLVHCALSGFGQHGPYGQQAGHDMTYVALTGALSQTGHPDTGPAIIFPPMADHSGAMQATSSILAALLRKEKTGKGAFIDVSLFESALAWQYLSLTPALKGTVDEVGQGELTGAASWYHIYQTQDGEYVAFAPIEPKFWKAFCEAVDRPDLLPRQNEPLPQKDLIAELEVLFKSRTRAQWEDVLIPADCCFEPVRKPDEVLNHPHIKHRQIAVEDQGNLQMRYPAWVDGQPPVARAQVSFKQPDEVLKDWQED